MFTSKCRQLAIASLKQNYTYPKNLSQMSKFTPMTVLPAFFPAAPGSSKPLLPADTNISSQQIQADKQQRGVLSQLIEKYGRDSNEVKEFTLTNAPLSPVDEIRMLTPCGRYFSNSVFYQILSARFQITDTEERANNSAKAYEQCLVDRVDDELEFWSKTYETAQISQGFVQGVKSQADLAAQQTEALEGQKNVSDSN